MGEQASEGAGEALSGGHRCRIGLSRFTASPEAEKKKAGGGRNKYFEDIGLGN